MKATFNVNPETLRVVVRGRAAIYDTRAVWQFSGIDLSGRELRCFAALPDLSGTHASTLTNPVTASGTADGATFTVSLSTVPLKNHIRAGTNLRAVAVVSDISDNSIQVIAPLVIEHAPRPDGIDVEEVEFFF